MNSDDVIETLDRLLFSNEEHLGFAVLDGASVPDLLRSLAEHEPEYVCLYRGELKPDVAEVAPYLVHLEPETDFMRWVAGEGWGKHWGIFASSSSNLRTLRQHFRSFLTVHDPDGKAMLFRYYDPRVMRTFLPTCVPNELETIFGPVQHYLVESDTADSIIKFQNVDGLLKEERLVLQGRER